MNDSLTSPRACDEIPWRRRRFLFSSLPPSSRLNLSSRYLRTNRLALAHRAVSEGARVSILARSSKKLEEAKKSIKLATGVEIAAFSADVRDYDAVSKAIDESGPIDVLVVNQGVFTAKELEKHSLEDIKFIIDVNLLGSFNVIKAALPAMKARKGLGPGSIALVSSQAGQVGIYGYAAYSASKFGLHGLAQSLQQEVIAYDIHVTLVFPPDTDTPGFEEEQKTRPEVTSIIAASSGSMKTEEVARKAMDGIKAGKFTVSCNFEGFLLSLATTGMSPQKSFWLAFLERARDVNLFPDIARQMFPELSMRLVM
ncbi:unnamed protein product [Cochlearia groenlandica]